MKPRLVVLLAVVLAAAALTGAGIRLLSSLPSSPPAVHAALAPNPVSYLGMLDTNSSLNYDAVESFTQAAGQQPNLLGYYSGWVEPFNTSFAQVLHQHGIVPVVQIDPTDASVSAIASGTYNDYLRSYADSVRDFGHAVVIGFGHEMNAPWYSWGYNHVPAATFIAAWRHIVTLFRDQGADNVTWLWTLQADEKGTRSRICFTGWPLTRRSGCCGSTSGRTMGPITRTGGSRTVRPPRYRSGWACAKSWQPQIPQADRVRRMIDRALTCHPSPGRDHSFVAGRKYLQTAHGTGG
jgi:hypothetical protein